jgi:2-polyprenyl-6-methoxyphenol hydroxylase-like FAD-dependent oxidoreductase
VLEERAYELGVEVRRGHELVHLSQQEDGVALRVRGPNGVYRMRTGYLAGCDGGHSTVRKQAGIAFPGVHTMDVVSRTGHVVIPGAQAVPRTVDLEVPGVGRIGMYACTRAQPGPAGRGQSRMETRRPGPGPGSARAAGHVRLAELMRNARPLLLDLSGGTHVLVAAAGWKDRVDTVAAACSRPPARALLIRPDGYVAWAAMPDDSAEHVLVTLQSALTTWFGAGDS